MPADLINLTLIANDNVEFAFRRSMTKRKPARRRLPVRHAVRLAGLALTLAAGVSMHSCAELPARRELGTAEALLQALFKGLGTVVVRQ